MDACLAETRPGTPTAQPAFARLLASVGINAISLSNVNAGFDANLLLLSSDFVQKAAALATVFGGGHLPHPVLLVAHDRGRGQPDDRRPLDPRRCKYEIKPGPGFVFCFPSKLTVWF